jgi:hypothetical protein
MKKIVSILIAAAFVATVLVAQNSTPLKDVKIKKTGNQAVSVIYSHSLHEKKTGIKAKDCTGCHNAVKNKDNAHKYCAECHVTMKKGPALNKCMDCHKTK